MSKLDDELKKALRREEPPPGFADRVLARVACAPPARRWWTRRWWTRRWWTFSPMRWAATAAVVVLLAGGVEIGRQRRLRAQGELAKEQVMLALRITGNKLQLVKEKVNGIDSTRH